MGRLTKFLVAVKSGGICGAPQIRLFGDYFGAKIADKVAGDVEILEGPDASTGNTRRTSCSNAAPSSVVEVDDDDDDGLVVESPMRRARASAIAGDVAPSAAGDDTSQGQTPSTVPTALKFL